LQPGFYGASRLGEIVIIEKLLRSGRADVPVVGPDETVLSITRLFEKRKRGLAAVCDPGRRLLGVVSLGDIVHAIGSHQESALNMPVREIMTSDLATCGPQDSVEDALKTMTALSIRHLLVVENGALKGLVSKRDALELLYNEAALDFEQMRNYVFKTGGRY
jgi:CBS domain-containing protein